MLRRFIAMLTCPGAIVGVPAAAAADVGGRFAVAAPDPGSATRGGAITPRDAARFLAQATLGADWDEIHRTVSIGLEAWLDEQFARPIGYHQP
jgi:hypothetical protein